MATQPKRYKIKRIDSKGKWLTDDSTQGEKYVIALIRAELGGGHSKHRNAKKIVLKREDGSRKPLKEFKYYMNKRFFLIYRLTHKNYNFIIIKL